MTISYKYKTAEIVFMRKKQRVQYYMNFELAKELSESDGFILDGGNDHYMEETYRIDRDKFEPYIDEDKIKRLKQKLVNIFLKYDSSYQTLTKRDLRWVN